MKLKIKKPPIPSYLKNKRRQFIVLQWVLVVASIGVVVLPIVDLYRVVDAGGSPGEMFGGERGLVAAGAKLVQSRLFLIFLVLSAWLLWFSLRRRRLNEIRLRRSEQKYRSIINYAGEAIFLLDADARILEWNKGAERLFGEPRRSVLGRAFRDIHLCYGIEVERAMADARRLHTSMTYEFPFPRRGKPVGQVSLTISPFTEESGDAESIYTFVILARDITSVKQLETRMSETEKLAGLGQLAAGTAHQLNTPLGSILLSAQMLEESQLGDDQLEDVRRIIRQTEQCRDIIKGLLNFARPSDSSREIIDLGGVVRETIYLMEKNIKLANVSVGIDDCGGIRVHGNRNELGQVFFNLLANALDATGPGGHITVKLDEGTTGENLITFADDGEGIPAEKQDNVFLPFYTTKEYGKGTGLGLSIVARIIHEHGGRIRLESEAGTGTSFNIAFPAPGYGLVSVDDGAEEGE